MLLSSRTNPPKALGDLPSRSNLTVRQLLASSSVPSPALPAPVARHGAKPLSPRRRRALRLLLRLCLVAAVYYLISLALKLEVVESSFHSIPYLSPSGKAYEIVGDVQLPDYPAPVSFPDLRGHRRWTVSVPQHLDFPLSPAEYADVCSHVKEVARHSGDNGAHAKANYQHYMDVDKAQAAGLLPAQMDIAEPGQDQSLPVCEKSLTFVLDSTEAGLGSALLGLWLSYGLAHEENRAFFIDDSQFAYGKFDTYFEMPPKPACRAPPKTQRVPCPHQAKHLIVSAATYRWTFGAASTFSSRHSERGIFRLARKGYEALFRLKGDDKDYVRRRVAELKSPSPTLLVGIHLRRGDRHPFEHTYNQAYLPPYMYRDAAEAFAADAADASLPAKVIIASDDPDTYLHDDFLSYTRAQDMISLGSKKTSGTGSVGWEGGFFKNQFWALGLPDSAYEQRKIGSPRPNRPRPPGAAKAKAKAQAKAQARAEARAKAKAQGKAWRTRNQLNSYAQGDSDTPSLAKREESQQQQQEEAQRQEELQKEQEQQEQQKQQEEQELLSRDYRTQPTDEARELRELVGRAYLLELSVLGQSDRVVCAVSAYACRILAVMMGWERAMEQGQWKNIDGTYDWRAIDV